MKKGDSILNFLGGSFQEDNGNYSSMRLMSFLALAASIWFGWLVFSRVDRQQEIFRQSIDIITQPQPLSEEKKALLEKIIDLQQQSALTGQSQNDFSEEFWIVLSFLSFSMGGKLVQKIVEPKEGRDFVREGEGLQLSPDVLERPLQPGEEKPTSLEELRRQNSGHLMEE